MRAKLIAIGNSKGIRLPKSVIDQYRLADEVELDLCAQGLLVSAVRQAREGWDDAFAQMARRGDDALMDTPAPQFDRKDWRW